MIRSAVRTTLCSLLRSDLVVELYQSVIEVQRMYLMMAEKNCFSSSCGRLNFLSWRRKNNLCWAFFTMDSMWLSHFRSCEMVGPRNPNDSHDGEWGESRGVSPEVHDHLHCSVIFKPAIELIQIICLLLILHSAGGWCLVFVYLFQTFPHWSRINER